jgi:hypothetical protein
MKAFHGDSKIKAKYVRRVNAHRKADQIVQGTGAQGTGKDFRGCAVGCLFNRYDHSLAPVEIGFPETLARLADAIHEGLPKAECVPSNLAKPSWIQRFTSAAKPGADLSLVWPKFAVWTLLDEKHGVKRFTKGYPEAEAVIDRVAALWQLVIAGESVESLRSEFYAADAAARAAYAAADAPYAPYAAARAAYAAADAAYAAADAADAAARAAYAAADAPYAPYAAARAAYAAARAAYAAADAPYAAARAAYAARNQFWAAAANKLESLLSEAT